MSDRLTHKQRVFADQYVKLNGNGTKAALIAGYSGGEGAAAARASENVRKRKVRQRIEYLTRKHEISADRVLTRLDNLSIKAEQEGQIGAAIKAEELLGKSLGMWVERSVNVNVDLNGEHLKALQDRMNRRRDQQLNARGNTIDVTPHHKDRGQSVTDVAETIETRDQQRQNGRETVAERQQETGGQSLEMGDGAADTRATHAVSTQEGS